MCSPRVLWLRPLMLIFKLNRKDREAQRNQNFSPDVSTNKQDDAS